MSLSDKGHDEGKEREEGGKKGEREKVDWGPCQGDKVPVMIHRRNAAVFFR